MRELSPEVLEAARWIQQQAEQHRYADIGFTASFHAGEVTRINYHITAKKKAGVPSLTVASPADERR